MPTGSVRGHTRKTATGKTTRVRNHSRRHRGGRGLVSPGHAWKNARRAFRAVRRKKKAAALGFGALALGELGAWATLRGVGLTLATAGVLALGVALLAAMASGMEI